VAAGLRSLLDLVLRDLQGSDPIAVRVGWDPERVWSHPARRDEVLPHPMLMFSEPGDFGGTGWAPAAPGAVGGYRDWCAEFTPAELAVGLAGHLQEQVFPETAAAWGQARPPCPGHRHSALLELIEGEAWWTCPADGRAIAKFGALREP
jgi:hypothetical protein